MVRACVLCLIVGCVSPALPAHSVPSSPSRTALPDVCRHTAALRARGVVREHEFGIQANLTPIARRGPWYVAQNLTGLDQVHSTNRTLVTIGLIDRAVRRDLPEFRDRIRNPAYVRGDDSHQRRDDEFGWNFVTNTNNTWTEVEGAHWCGHGNKVAGAIVSPRNESFFGAFPDAFIVPAVVYDREDPELSDVVDALCYFLSLRQRGLNLAAINVSMGFCENEMCPSDREGLRQIVDALGDVGVLIVASAANITGGCRAAMPVCPRESPTAERSCRNHDICGFLPATLGLPNVVGVTGANEVSFHDMAFGAPCDAVCDTPGWGNRRIDLHAPAEGVATIGWTGLPMALSGNSYAVPIVAAIAAMVVDAHPEVRGAALRRRLLRATLPLQHCSYRNRSCSGGIINAPRAIAGDGDAGARCFTGS
jgi:hypothetical protein